MMSLKFKIISVLCAALYLYASPLLCDAANDFSGDANLAALWNLEEESGNRVDSSGNGNTLTDINTVEFSSDSKQGTNSSSHVSSSNEVLQIDDTDLSADFPLKNGDTNKEISVCVWVKASSMSVTMGIFSKHDTSGKRSFQLMLHSTPNFRVAIGHNNGESSETIVTTGTPVAGRWYHIAVTFKNSDKSWKMVVWDDTASSKIINASGTSDNNINVEDASVLVGGNYLAAGSPNTATDFDGLIDEVVVFKDILTTGEIDKIRAGTYGAATTTTSTTSTTTSTTSTTTTTTTPTTTTTTSTTTTSTTTSTSTTTTSTTTTTLPASNAAFPAIIQGL